MSKNGFSRMNVFLIELMVMILVFAMAAAILLQVFVRADQLSKDASSLSSAVIAAENAMEQQLSLEFSELSSPPDTVWYDQDWQPVRSKDDAAFGLMVENTFASQDSGTLVHFNVWVFEPGENSQVYQLESAQYYGGVWREGDRR